MNIRLRRGYGEQVQHRTPNIADAQFPDQNDLQLFSAAAFSGAVLSVASVEIEDEDGIVYAEVFDWPAGGGALPIILQVWSLRSGVSLQTAWPVLFDNPSIHFPF